MFLPFWIASASVAAAVTLYPLELASSATHPLPYERSSLQEAPPFDLQSAMAACSASA
jgi:hypothetical protein